MRPHTTLLRTSICSVESRIQTTTTTSTHRTIFLVLIHHFHPPHATSLNHLRTTSSLPRRRHLGLFWGKQVATRSSYQSKRVLSLEATEYDDEGLHGDATKPLGLPMDALEKLLTTNRDEIARFMKMERKSSATGTSAHQLTTSHWFPYLDMYKVGETILTSSDVLEALDPYILETRKERLRTAVKNRTYSVCLVIEGLNDIANASAIFRSADALGFQSVHVIAFDCSKRFRENRRVSVGAEKWLDIELWDSTKECFDALKTRGYCIAATHVGTKAVSVYEINWSGPTAIVVGNETRGISDEALELADTIFSIPMKGMVESLNVSVASALIMHHALFDRNSRLGCHGDLTPFEQQVLLAEFFLRHNEDAISIVHEHTRRPNRSSRQKEGPQIDLPLLPTHSQIARKKAKSSKV